MAIVWACALSVDEYVAAGHAVAAPRPDCPACATPMVSWSGYERSVRQRGPALKLWVRRARCGRCRASHALVPSFCLVGRLDAVEVIGEALTAVVDEARGRGRWRRRLTCPTPPPGTGSGGSVAGPL